MDENNMNQGFPENPDGYQAAPNNGEYANYNADPNGNAYGGYNADPNGNAYGGYNADPNMGGYADYNADAGNGGYVQPEMNAYGDQVPYQVPAPKKKKGGKIALISLIAVVLVAAIVAVVFFLVRKTPEEVIKSSIKKTITDTVDKSPVEEATGISEFSDDKMDFDVNMTVNSIYRMDGIAGSNLDLNGAFEKQSDNSYNMNLNGSLSIADQALSASVYCVDRVIYFELPELYNDVFKMDLASMMDALDTSDLDTDTQNKVKELYEKYMTPANEDLKKAISFDKVGNVTVENHNGDSVSCKQYTVTLPTADVKAYVTALCNYLNAYASEFITDEQLESADITRSDLAQVFNYVPTYYGILFSRDFVLNVYVKHNEVVKLGMDYKFTVLNAEASLAVDFMGTDSPADDIYAALSVTKDEEELASVTISDKSENGKGSYTKKLEETVVVNGETTATLTQNSSFVKSTNAFESHMTVSAAEQPVFAYDLTGSLKDINKGKSYTVAIDSLKVTNGDSTVYADLSGEIKLGDLGAEIKAPDSSKNVIDYTEMTDDYMQNNMNTDNLEKIVSAWKKALGSSADIKDDISLGDLTSSDIDLGDISDIEDDSEMVVDSADIDDQDYSGIKMSGDSYTIAIKDPSGYDRGYADDSEVDIYNDKYNVYYTLTPDCDKEKECKNFKAYFDYLGEDGKVVDEKMEQVTGANGQTLDCYVINSEVYGTNTRDYYYFYPVNDKDYLVVNVNVWADGEGEEVKADITAIADELVNDQVIDIQK